MSTAVTVEEDEMHLVRFRTGEGHVRVGVRSAGTITAIATVRSIAELMHLRAGDLRAVLESAERATEAERFSAADVRLLPPLDGRGEVWCAGVTYERSRGARMEESSEQSVYDRVYAAVRPELFPKSPAWRVVTDGEPIGIRSDSGHDVPEPELAVVVNRYAEIVGYTVCDDVSSRSIEGDNPLYIPQAKLFAGSCALAAGIRPAWEVSDATDLEIRMSVRRVGAVAFEGSTSTATLARPLPDLVAALTAANDFPDGVVLATGTGIVPEMEFTLLDGDIVHIEVDQVGLLTNKVSLGKDAFDWLSDDTRPRPQLEAAR